MTGGLSSFSQATHSAAGAVVSKPREIASLIRNKFGSADNIAALKDSLDETQGDEGVGPAGARTLGAGQLQSSPKYGSEDDCSSATSGSAGANSTTGAPGGPPSSKGNTLDYAQGSGFDALLHEIQELRENQGRLEESFENLKAHYQRDYRMIMEALQDERYRSARPLQYHRVVCPDKKTHIFCFIYCHVTTILLCRCERLEEQLNDLTELHQNEILNLKQELASMEEKIAYQSYERARDIQVCSAEINTIVICAQLDLLLPLCSQRPHCLFFLSLSVTCRRRWKRVRRASPKWSYSSSNSRWCSWRAWRTPPHELFSANSSTCC